MFITNMMLTLKIRRLFHLAPNTDDKDLHLQMQMWYLYQTGISLQVPDVAVEGWNTEDEFEEVRGHLVDEFEEEEEEEEGDRVPFDDITNQLAWSYSINTHFFIP